jgi:malate/lactate dehydrogenase
VEQIFELQLDAGEKAELEKSFQSVKKTVDAVRL